MKTVVTLDNNLWYAQVTILCVSWLKIKNRCDPLAYVKLFKKLYTETLS